MSAPIAIQSTVRGTRPRIPFSEMKTRVLGTSYELSLVLVGDALAQKLNRTYRKKNYRPNVLSFPLDKNTGEIFINIRLAEREAKRTGMRTNDRIAHLFVHGCLHLKGRKHGRRMDREEKNVLKEFGFKISTHFGL